MQDSDGGSRFGVAVVLLVALLLLGLGSLAFVWQRVSAGRAQLARRAAEQFELQAVRETERQARLRASATATSLPEPNPFPEPNALAEPSADSTTPTADGPSIPLGTRGLRVIPDERCTRILQGNDWLFVQDLGEGATALVFGLGEPAQSLPEPDPDPAGTSPRIGVMTGVRKLLPLSGEHTLHLLVGNSSIDLTDRDQPGEHDAAILELLRHGGSLGAVLAKLTQVERWEELVR